MVYPRRVCTASRCIESPETKWFCLGPCDSQLPSAISGRIPYLSTLNLLYDGLTAKIWMKTKVTSTNTHHLHCMLKHNCFQVKSVYKKNLFSFTSQPIWHHILTRYKITIKHDFSSFILLCTAADTLNSYFQKTKWIRVI